MRFASALGLLLVAVTDLPAAIKISVTVVDHKTGRPISGLQAGDFAVFEEKTPRRIETVEFSTGIVDAMLLLDTGLAGEMVRPVAGNLIAQLEPKESMAIVSFHSSADLIQDFTSSKELLSRAVEKVRYGNTPRVLDALYQAIDGGFENSSFRRVIVLLTTGLEGQSRVTEREVIRLARRNGVSIFPVYVVGYERGMFESLARQTGGASFSLRDMKKTAESPGPRIFEVLRGHYTLTLAGNTPLSEKYKIEIKRPEKVLISALPLE
jgi:VWFA-related protein